MKKNKMMRLASAMMVLTLMSTSVISGTFAKYVTTASSTDTARVAKWGVEVTSTSDMFNKTYETDDTTVKSSIANSVDSSNEDKLVAPGTTKSDVAFTIKGTPEVAVNVSVKIDEKDTGKGVKDVVLKAGTYTDYTKVTGADASNNPQYGNSFTLSEDYHPLVWTLKNGTVVVASGKLSEIETYLENTTTGLSKNHAANTNLATVDAGSSGTGEYTLSWTWAYEYDGTDEQKALYNAADTFIGNLAAGKATADPEDYCLDVAYTLSITVTQID